MYGYCHYILVIKCTWKRLYFSIRLSNKIEVVGKGWDLLKFRFKKSSPIKIVVGKYRSRSYFTNYELRKAFKKKIEDFTVNKVITRTIKVYE